MRAASAKARFRIHWVRAWLFMLSTDTGSIVDSEFFRLVWSSVSFREQFRVLGVGVV